MDFGLSQITAKRGIILYTTGCIRSYVMYELFFEKFDQKSDNKFVILFLTMVGTKFISSTRHRHNSF